MKIQMTKKERVTFLIIILVIVFTALIYFTYKNTLEIKDTTTIIALLLGPVIAVVITRYNDQVRIEKERQLMTFRTLMLNRSDPLSKEFVAALNLIEVDFNKHQQIKNAWKELFDALHPRVKPQTPEEQTQQFILWQSLTTRLLHEIGKQLNIEIEQLDIMQRVYAPQGWLDEKNRKDTINNQIDRILLKLALPRSQMQTLVNHNDPDVLDLLTHILNMVNNYINTKTMAQETHEDQK